MSEYQALESLNEWLQRGVPDASGSCYVARIEGSDAKWGFERTFVSDVSHRNKLRVDPEEVSEGDVFELCFMREKAYLVVEAVRVIGGGSKATKDVFDVEIEKGNVLDEVTA